MKPISKFAVLALMMTLILGGPMAVWSMDLSSEEEDALLWMREEEKLARDVYYAMYDLWGQAIFDNIAASEEKHMDAVKTLLHKYGLPDPAENKDPGRFENWEIQNLYNYLVDIGESSAVEALWVGATIEDCDIYDLQGWLEQVDNKDIIRVFSNLKAGSENHLCSFVSHLGSYDAQGYLDQDKIDAILEFCRETGR